ncbi:hypothetical protein BC832DRAFT_392249 [Gaertneriomyces semiglobifer]|nr:hypothetical protein BC832DRAFT_392249 [Gaertneriomyces semiglobifer]
MPLMLTRNPRVFPSFRSRSRLLIHVRDGILSNFLHLIWSGFPDEWGPANIEIYFRRQRPEHHGVVPPATRRNISGQPPTAFPFVMRFSQVSRFNNVAGHFYENIRRRGVTVEEDTGKSVERNVDKKPHVEKPNFLKAALDRAFGRTAQDGRKRKSTVAPARSDRSKKAPALAKSSRTSSTRSGTSSRRPESRAADADVFRALFQNPSPPIVTAQPSAYANTLVNALDKAGFATTLAPSTSLFEVLADQLLGVSGKADHVKQQVIDEVKKFGVSEQKWAESIKGSLKTRALQLPATKPKPLGPLAQREAVGWFRRRKHDS